MLNAIAFFMAKGSKPMLTLDDPSATISTESLIDQKMFIFADSSGSAGCVQYMAVLSRSIEVCSLVDGVAVLALAAYRVGRRFRIVCIPAISRVPTILCCQNPFCFSGKAICLDFGPEGKAFELGAIFFVAFSGRVSVGCVVSVGLASCVGVEHGVDVGDVCDREGISGAGLRVDETLVFSARDFVLFDIVVVCEADRQGWVFSSIVFRLDVFDGNGLPVGTDLDELLGELFNYVIFSVESRSSMSEQLVQRGREKRSR